MSKAKKIILVIMAVCLLIPLSALSVSADTSNSYNIPLSNFFTSGTSIAQWDFDLAQGCEYAPVGTDSNSEDNYFANTYNVTFSATSRIAIMVQTPIYNIEVPKGCTMKIKYGMFLFNFAGVYPNSSYFQLKNNSTGQYIRLESVTAPSNNSHYVEVIYEYKNTTNATLNLDFMSVSIQFDPAEKFTNKNFVFGFGNDGINIEVYQTALDQERNEAESGGNSGVNDLTNAIPTDTGGLINAFGSLTNSMLHTNTTCVISFPQIKTPAILGIIPEYTLTEAKQVDFEETVKLIPEPIMKLVQALLTIALILFCFKELYSTISYVLTLKGGGTDNE